MKKPCDARDLRQLLHDFGIRSNAGIRIGAGGNCLIIYYQGAVLRVGVTAQLCPELEAQVIAAAGESGLPVPKNVHIGETTGHVPYMIYEEIIGDHPDSSFDWKEMGGYLYRFHHQTRKESFPTRPFTLAARASRIEHARRVQSMKTNSDQRIAKYLDMITEPRKALPVHGDIRINNLLAYGNHLNGVLDWSDAHQGDPEEDIAYLPVAIWEKVMSGYSAPLSEELLVAYGLSRIIALEDRQILPPHSVEHYWDELIREGVV